MATEIKYISLYLTGKRLTAILAINSNPKEEEEEKKSKTTTTVV